VGVRVWMDRFDIPVGAYWPDEIDLGLASSDVVVGVLSPEAVASRDVKNEWDWAIANDRRLLLVHVRECVVPHRYVSINRIDAVGLDSAAALGALSEALGVAPPEPVALATPETRYAQHDGVSIAYQALGDGPPDLVLIPGWVSNLEYSWEHPTSARFSRSLATFSRLIMFDKRGTGLSDRVSEPLTLEQGRDDLRAVIDAAGSDRAALLGISEGGAIAMLFAIAYPERTTALILYGAYARAIRATDYPGGITEEEHRTQIAMIERHWGSEEYIRWSTPRAAEDDSLRVWLTRYFRLSASPRAALALARFGAEIDIRDALRSITVPVLIVHRRGDPVSNLEDDRYLAAHIPGARLVELPEDVHEGILGDHTPLVHAIETFLASAEPAAASMPGDG
jgi:pimeloyl-ACP methyl ester carboxylesterase